MLADGHWQRSSARTLNSCSNSCCPQDECHTEFVNTYGFLTGMDVKPQEPREDDDDLNEDDYVGQIKNGSTVFVISSALPKFVENVFPTISQDIKFVLVTGVADVSVPFEPRHYRQEPWPGLQWEQEEFENFINDTRIIHWFTQNQNARHPKLSSIPIGLDYYHLNEEAYSGVGQAQGAQATPQQQEKDLVDVLRYHRRPWKSRGLAAFCNFHFGLDSIEDERSGAQEILQRKGGLHWQEDWIDRVDVWKAVMQYKFVISPFGNGMDCFRTWEALILGSVPIIRKGPWVNEQLFEGLPVILLDDWEDFDATKANQQMQKLNLEEKIPQKVTMKYWLDLIRQTAEKGHLPL